jgi:Protein of unknown function (DUF4064)
LKRKPEFVLGLIGSIIGIVFCVAIAFILGAKPVNDGFYDHFKVSFFIGLFQIAAIIFSCLVNNMNHKVYGCFMIAFGLITMFGSLYIVILLVPAILYLISGGLAFRKLKPVTNTING